MSEIIIDEQFKFLLPKLDEETYRLLEESLLEHGCREPLVLWKNGENEYILIDGYNRYKICTEHDIAFNTIEMEFNLREEVLVWIIQNQVSRRNLTPIQLSHFRGLHYKADRKIQGHFKKSEIQTFAPGGTASRLAEQYRVSRDTINRDAKLANAINKIGETSPEAKRKILSGEIAVSRTKLEALNLNSQDEVEAVAAGIEDGTYVRRTPQTPNQASLAALLPEIKQLNTIIKDFASNFNSLIIKLSADETTDVKPALRSYIDQLEELYRNMS